MRSLSIGKNVILLNDEELNILTKAVNILGECGDTNCKDCPFKLKSKCIIAHLEYVRQEQKYSRAVLGVKSVND